MKRYDVSRLPSMIELGYDGENNWRPNSFDCSALLKNHPSGVISLWLLPQGESQAFPVALERDGNTVTWTPMNEEMTAEHGQLQIVVQDGTDVGKSKVIAYDVRDSLVGGADHTARTHPGLPGGRAPIQRTTDKWFHHNECLCYDYANHTVKEYR